MLRMHLGFDKSFRFRFDIVMFKGCFGFCNCYLRSIFVPYRLKGLGCLTQLGRSHSSREGLPNFQIKHNLGGTGRTGRRHRRARSHGAQWVGAGLCRALLRAHTWSAYRMKRGQRASLLFWGVHDIASAFLFTVVIVF